VYSESAIPTMFYALDHPSNWDHVLDDMVYNWDHWNSNEDVRKNYDPARRWTPQLSALHPMEDLEARLEGQAGAELGAGGLVCVPAVWGPVLSAGAGGEAGVVGHRGWYRVTSSKEATASGTGCCCCTSIIACFSSQREVCFTVESPKVQ